MSDTPRCGCGVRVVGVARCVCCGLLMPPQDAWDVIIAKREHTHPTADIAGVEQEASDCQP